MNEKDKMPEALRTAAEAVQAWSNINDFWPLPDSDCGEMVLGAIEDGTKYELLQIDADNYGTDGESEKLARFYAAANPGAVLALLDERDRLAAQVASLTASAPADLPGEVFGDADSSWNRERERLETAVLMTAAELVAKTGASGLSVEGYGVSVKVKEITTNG